MSALGNSINGGLVLLVVLAVVGTVGATFYYQHSVEQLDDRTDVLSNRTQTLERNLTATRSDLRAARERARELNQSLGAAKSDVSTLSGEVKQSRSRSSATSSELTEKQRRLQKAEDELAATKADLRAACNRLEELDATAGTESAATPDDPWADEPWNGDFSGYGEDDFVDLTGGNSTPSEGGTASGGDGASGDAAAVCQG